jgi:hypothetical protein
MTNTTAPTAPAARLRRRLRRGVLVLAAPLIAVGAAACQPSGCQADCITSLALNPSATTATVVTTVPTTVKVEIFADSGRTILKSSKTSASPATTHNFGIGQLQQAATYWYKVTATDAGNNMRYETGSIKTYQRKVDVKINRIHLIDDSDAVGTGEMSFHLEANDDRFVDVYVNNDMASGTDKTGLSITRTVPSSGPTLTLAVEGYDDDCDFACYEVIDFTSGSDSGADWATAKTAPITLPTTNGSGAWSATTAGYDVEFEVFGTYTVTYSPS